MSPARRSVLVPFPIALLVGGACHREEPAPAPPIAAPAPAPAPPAPAAPPAAPAPAAPPAAPSMVPPGVGHIENPEHTDAEPSKDAPPLALDEARAAARGAREGIEERLAAACKAHPDRVLRLVGASSRVGYVSYKNKELPVAGKFDQVWGFADLADPPGAWLVADVTSLNSGDAVRDARLLKLFFEAEKPAHAAISFASTSIEGAGGLPAKEGESAAVTVEGKVTMHGGSAQVSLPLKLTRQGAGYRADLSEVTLLQFQPFGLHAGPLVALMRACNHAAMGTAVKLEFDLVLEKGCAP